MAVVLLAVVLLPVRDLVQAKTKAEGPFSFETVVAKAREMAKAPYADPAPLPRELIDTDYDDWRDIRFKPENSLWRGEGLPVELQWFHPGFLYQQTVDVHLVEGGKVRPLVVTRDMFDYGRNQDLEQTMPEAEAVGVAGFRVHGPINTPQYFDEYLVFLGASYLRAVARGERYGCSARGLAVDTATPRGEEFPWFREFWIQKPRKGESEMWIYALLDSQSLCGAYAFRVRPGEETVIDVSARIFLRRKVDKLGLGPLTSMFFYGENSPPSPIRDWRPEVHDSDGLMIRFASGEWLWRPLQNPQTLEMATFQADDVRGFGFMQRDTDFDHYQDLEARYELRPSVWIEPRKGWGAGHIELVQIPSQREYHDNMVAYWCPDVLPEDGQPLKVEYRMRWMNARGMTPPGAHVAATRASRVDERTRLFIVDFEGENLLALPPGAGVSAVVSCAEGGEIVESQAFRNEATGGWRLVFKVVMDSRGALQSMLPGRDQPLELRAFLKYHNEALSETWSYAVRPGNEP
ncbi:MAG: glucan biosynthesis protein [Desulfovibrionaceae bacterium]